MAVLQDSTKCSLRIPRESLRYQPVPNNRVSLINIQCLKRNPANSIHCIRKDCGHKRCNNCLDSVLDDLSVRDSKATRITAISIPAAKGKRWICFKMTTDALCGSTVCPMLNSSILCKLRYFGLVLMNVSQCLQHDPANSAYCSREDCSHQRCINFIDSPFEDLPVLKEQA